MTNFHFLNVGHGDCTVIEFPSGNTTMIDINNGDFDDDTKNEIYEELKTSRIEYLLQKMQSPTITEKDFLFEKGYEISLTNPLEWLSQRDIANVFRFICTHPDMDHISGIDALVKKVTIANFWDTNHNFTHKKEDFDDARYSYDDWLAYETLRISTSNPKRLMPERNHSRDFWKQDGIYILSPDQDLIDISHEKDEKNHLSYVLMVIHGSTKIYLCGDATNDHSLPNIFEFYGEDFFKKKEGEIIILKAPHHGRKSGFYKPFVEAIKPDAVIVSVGKKPDTDSSNEYRNHSDNVLSTRWKGNISLSCNSDGTTTYEFEYNR